MKKLLLLCALLSACAVSAPPLASSGPVSFMVWGDTAEKQAYEQLVEAFRRQQPQLEIELVHVPGQSDYRKRLGVDFAAGTPADIVLLNYRRYAAFAAKDVLEPLGPYMQRSEQLREADYFAEALDPFRWNGSLMCVPQNLSSLVVFYNRELFRAAGIAEPSDTWSWSDFLGAAQALTRDEDGDGRTDQYGLGTEVSLFRLAPFIWQNGGTLVDDQQQPSRLTLDSPASREALQWFVDLQVVHHVVPDAVAEAAEDSESRFLNGRLGMFLNSRRGVPTYRSIDLFDWDVAPLPVGRERAGILHADGYCMAKASKNKAAAWAFIEFANSSEGQRIVAASGRTVPSLREVAEGPEFLDPNAKPRRSRVFLDGIAELRGVPIMATWADIEDLVGKELESAYYGRASVQQFIDAADQRVAPFFVR